MKTYESLAGNKIPFEMIFVGNKIPQFKLPENCHFIYSETKPVQCLEIGARYAQGEYIMNFADDVVFSPHALDNLYREFRELNDDKAVLSCRYVLEGKDIAGECGYYWVDNHNSPLMALSGFMKKEVWERIGGIDKRFVALFWDADIVMRVYEIGGRVVLSKDVKAEEFHPSKSYWKNKPSFASKVLAMFPRLKVFLIKIILFLERNEEKKRPRLFMEYGIPVDRPLLESLWVVKKEDAKDILPELIHCIDDREDRGALLKKRLQPVQAFENKHILTVSQGPKGRWK